MALLCPLTSRGYLLFERTHHLEAERTEQNRTDGGGDSTRWKSWDRVGVAASVVSHGLISVAFLFLSLALVTYVKALGWVILGLVSLCLVLGLGLSLFQIVVKDD